MSAKKRRLIAGRITSNSLWMTSPSCSTVLASWPKTINMVTSTVKRLRSSMTSSDFARLRSFFPASLQSLGDLLDPRKNLMQVTLCKGGDG